MSLDHNEPHAKHSEKIPITVISGICIIFYLDMVKRLFRIKYYLFLIFSLSISGQAQESQPFSVSIPRVVLKDIQFQINVTP
ncbi:MAG: hypothetical protein ACK2TU_11350, partial [Anaerolineales bacterium]